MRSRPSIIERPLPDGRAEVTVLLHTRKALTWVAAGLDPAGLLLFGHRAPDALGESMLQVMFINTAPGALLPDLMQLFFFPLPGQEARVLAMRAQADGTLRALFGVPDGTPGRAEETQTGLFMTGFKGAVADGFPVEHIKLRATGK